MDVSRANCSHTASPRPCDAAELTNNTGKTLDGGPITVYEAGAYAGEALVETLPMGDKRLISYGVDLATRVSTAFDTAQAVVRELHFRRGILTAKKREVAENDAALRRADEEAASLNQDQGRLRNNMESLNRVSGQQEQVQQYARQLAATEARLAALRGTQNDLRKKKAAFEGELTSLLERLEF